MAKHVSQNSKCKLNNTACNSDQKWSNKTCQYECKNYRTCKKDYNWNPSTCIYENDKYLKSIADTSVITCDEIISVMDIVSTKITNTITSDLSVNSDDKRVRYKTDCYILYTVLLAIVSLLIITIICYDYAKHRSKQKSTNALTI